jgi:hypothetical protein
LLDSFVAAEFVEIVGSTAGTSSTALLLDGTCSAETVSGFGSFDTGLPGSLKPSESEPAVLSADSSILFSFKLLINLAKTVK